MNIDFLKLLGLGYKNIWPMLFDWIGGAVIGTLFTGLVSQVRVSNIKKNYKLPIKVPRGDKRNLILLVGLGGTGKTSLIRTLFRDEKINHRKKTESFTTYCYKHDAGVKQTTRKSFLKKWYPKHNYHWLYISDYKGQNIAQLLRHFILEQRQPNSPLAFGYINSLIFLVDLFPPKKEVDAPEPKKQKEPDQERIYANIEQWNNTTLTMLSGLITDDLKSIILFINKLDLLVDRSDKTEEQCKRLYDDLRKRIETIFGGIDCHVILGSATKGTNVSGVDSESLMFYLLTSSVFPES